MKREKGDRGIFKREGRGGGVVNREGREENRGGTVLSIISYFPKKFAPYSFNIFSVINLVSQINRLGGGGRALSGFY